MATGTYGFGLLGASFDETNPPGVEWVNQRPYLTFDQSTDELIYLVFQVPADYSSSPVLKIIWSGSSSTTTSHTVRWAAEVMASTPDTDNIDINTDSYDTSNEVDDDILGTTARRPQGASLTLTNFDSGAAGDYMAIKFYRNANHANDDLNEDAWLHTLALEYTTS